MSFFDVRRRRIIGGPALTVLAVVALLGATACTLTGRSTTAAVPPGVATSATKAPPREREAGTTSPVTAADGVLPDGTGVFDEEYAGIARLDPGLLAALRVAAADAAEHGITIQVSSGWRSPDYQEKLLRAAVSTYGSKAEAARWVATPETSPHVQGQAVDLGPAAAQRWLSAHGAGYGLCQIYRNEPWHFELRPEAVDGRCPPLYPDPSHDPRLS